MPFRSGRLQPLIAFNNCPLTGTSDTKLYSKNRDSHEYNEQDIEQYKYRSTILSYYIRKFPYISDSDCTSRTYQDKAKSTPKVFSFFFCHDDVSRNFFCNAVVCILLRYILMSLHTHERALLRSVSAGVLTPPDILYNKIVAIKEKV